MRQEAGMHGGLDVAPSDADAGEIAGYVEANRAALDRTLSELEHRISPQAVFDAALDRLRHGGGVEYARGLRDSVVRNPLPVTLAAVGLAWTMFSERHPPAPGAGAGNGHAAHRAGERMREGLKETGENLSGRAREMRTRGQGWLRHGREGIHSAQARASAWGSAAAERSRESAARAEAFSREHPLIVAGAGLTLGAILAALLPTTRVEDEYIGSTRDQLMADAGEAIGHTSRPVSQSADEVVQSAGEALGARVSGSVSGVAPEAGSSETGEVRPPAGMDRGPGTEGGR